MRRSRVVQKPTCSFGLWCFYYVQSGGQWALYELYCKSVSNDERSVNWESFLTMRGGGEVRTDLLVWFCLRRLHRVQLGTWWALFGLLYRILRVFDGSVWLRSCFFAVRKGAQAQNDWLVWVCLCFLHCVPLDSRWAVYGRCCRTVRPSGGCGEEEVSMVRTFLPWMREVREVQTDWCLVFLFSVVHLDYRTERCTLWYVKLVLSAEKLCVSLMFERHSTFLTAFLGLKKTWRPQKVSEGVSLLLHEVKKGRSCFGKAFWRTATFVALLAF